MAVGSPADKDGVAIVSKQPHHTFAFALKTLQTPFVGAGDVEM